MARKLRSAMKRKAVEPVESSSEESEHEPEIKQKDASVKTVELERSELTSKFAKRFTLAHVFKNVSILGVDTNQVSQQMEHFGLNWCIGLTRFEDKVGLFICRQKFKSEKTKIDVEKLEVNGEIHFSSEFIYEMAEMEVSNTHFYGGWAHDISSTGQDDSVSVKFTVAILHSEGLIERMVNFDEQKKDVSDATLILNGENFYVSKLYLATHSTIFKPMFVGNLADKHINVTIKDIDPTDMQAYLEVLYGYRDIEENTVEGLILLGKRLQTDIILNKSQKFLMDKSVKELKKKFELSTKYELDDLITWCFSNRKTLHDVKMCIPEEDLTRRLNSLAPEIITKLLQKVLLLH